MLRAIDKGLANSRGGLVLVTPAFLAKLGQESVSEKEVPALFAGNPRTIVHGTTYTALREVSPLLGLPRRARHGRRCIANVEKKHFQCEKARSYFVAAIKRHRVRPWLAPAVDGSGAAKSHRSSRVPDFNFSTRQP
jgi:hypothetical protein